jgi:hypothetical protein
VRPLLAIFVGLLAAVPLNARAEEPSALAPTAPTGVEAEPEPRRGSLLAVGASVVPGILVHGAGHFVLGERKAAYRLFAIEGVGLAGIVGGMGVLASVGGSEKLAPLYVPLVVGGLGLFGASFLGDAAGAAHGARPWPEPRLVDGLTLRTGYVGLFDSKHTFGHMGALSGEWRDGRLVLEGGATLHPRGNYRQYRGLAGWRVWAPAGERVTRLTLFGEVARQAFPGEGFSITTGRAFGELRQNLGAFVPTLQNTWLLGRLGWGIDSLDYTGAAAADALQFLVAETGYGLMATEHVEVELVYRQRKGELPGGLILSDGLAGFAGILELRGRVIGGGRWALAPGVKLGTGVMPWLSVESQLF